MKKNTISIDFIAFGELDSETTKKLEVFNENIKSTDGSHLAIIPPGPNLLSDILMTTEILAGDGVGPREGDGGIDGGGEGAGGFEFGVDPSTDPELALALRMSMEEEKARLEKEGAKAQEEASKEPQLEGIPEELGESQPLLNEAGEASGSGDPMRTDVGENKQAKDGDGDGDKMDIA
jgi:26S proteasome regulatory subunit N10